MHDKTVPAIISVIGIIALILIFIFIIRPAQTPDDTDTTTAVEQPAELPVKPAPIIAPESAVSPEPESIPATEPTPPEPSLIEPPLSLKDSDSQVLLAVANFAPD